MRMPWLAEEDPAEPDSDDGTKSSESRGNDEVPPPPPAEG